MVSLISIWFYPSVENFISGNRMWNGVKNFVEAFEAREINSLEELPAVPESTALVAIPYLEYSRDSLSLIEDYLNNGATVLLMDDYGYGNTLLNYLNLEAGFTGDVLLDPLFNYKNPYLPRITDFSPALKTNEVEAVLFNHATSLRDVPGMNVLAWSSPESYLDVNNNDAMDAGEPAGPFPVAAEIGFGRGRLLLVSDPSTIINTMVERDDNYSFISELLTYRGEIGTLYFDNSHLSSAPLDISKARLTDTREILSNPYSVVGIMGLMFVGISRFTLRKGDSVV